MTCFFEWIQLKHVNLWRWKTLMSNHSHVNKHNLYQNHHVIKGARILSADKISCKEIYSILFSNIVSIPQKSISENCLKTQL